MNPNEYSTMFAVEERHWWYRGLRGLILDAFRRIGVSETDTALDIGCGTGANLTRIPVHAVGIDRAPEALGLSRRRGLTSLCRADALDLPFADNSFSVVLMSDVLYHRGIADKLVALREAARVLRPNGHLVLNVPAYQWLYSAHDEAIHTDRRFTAREVRHLLTAAGFDVDTLTYWNTLLFPVAAASRLLHRSKRDAGSDLVRYRPGFADAGPRALLALERRWLRRFRLPAGLSVFAVGRRTARHAS